MGASWQAFYAHLCAASIIRAMPETEIPPAMRGDLYFTIPFFVRIPPKSLRFGHSVVLSIALFTKVTVQYFYKFGYALLYV